MIFGSLGFGRGLWVRAHVEVCIGSWVRAHVEVCIGSFGICLARICLFFTWGRQDVARRERLVWVL